jgi:hypothetical protein
MKLNKSSLILAVILITTGCSTPVSVSTVNPPQLLSKTEISELDKEYVFSSKALTKNYFKRKLDKWLNPLNGTMLTKELVYARVKHPSLYNELMTEFPPMYLLINTAPAIVDRKNLEPLFKEFIEMANPYPATPVATAATDITPTSFRANWNAANNATSYTLFVTDTGTGTTTPYEPGDVTTYELTGLNSDSSYSYYLKANNSAGSSAASSTIPVNTLIPAPGAPVANAATDVAPESFTANWELVSGAVSYTLYVTDNSNSTTTPYDLGNVSSYTVTGLNNQSPYSYYVKANNSTGLSPASNTIPVTTLIPIPDTPVANAATDIDPTSFTANWEAANYAADYTLYVTDTSTGTTTPYNLPSVNSYNVTGLNSNSAYSYYVKANNSTGSSTGSNIIQVNTLIPVPDAPVANAPTDVTPNSFTANWDSVNFAADYTLYVTDVGAGTTTPYDLGNVTSKNITGLNSNTSYSYYIKANNSTGSSANSNTVPVITLVPVPDAPVASAATVVTSTSFTANWISVNFATDYTLYVTNTGTGITTPYNVGNVTSKNVTGLNSNASYSYNVTATNSTGTGAASNNVPVTTLVPAPNTPVIGSATAVTSSSFTANWSTVSFADSYTLYVTNTVTSVTTPYNVGNVGSYDVTNLNSLTGYSYYVTASNISGTSGNSSSTNLSTTLRGEFRLNSYTTGGQRGHSLAMDTDGNFVVTWTSPQDPGGSDGIYARRFNSYGNPLGPEFRVNTYTTGIQNSASVAMDTDGDFVVSWSSDGQDGSGYGIYAQKYNNTGTPVGGEFKVSTFTPGSQDGSSIAMDNTGDFVISWTSAVQDPDGSAGIYAQRFNNAGPAGTEFRVNTFTAGLQNGGSVAMDNSGNFIIGWSTAGQDGDSTGIFAKRYNNTGTALAAEFGVTTFTANQQHTNRVAMDSAGNSIFTWRSNGQDGSIYGVYGQRYNNSGIRVGTEFQANTQTAGNQYANSATLTPNGDFIVAWSSENGSQDGSSSGTYAQRFNASASKVGPEFRVNTYTTDFQEGTAIASDSAGNFVIIWRSDGQDGSGAGIYGKSYKSDGTER